MSSSAFRFSMGCLLIGGPSLILLIGVLLSFGDIPSNPALGVICLVLLLVLWVFVGRVSSKKPSPPEDSKTPPQY